MSRKSEIDEALPHWPELRDAWQKALSPGAIAERQQFRSAMRRHYWRNWEFGFPFLAALAFSSAAYSPRPIHSALSNRPLQAQGSLRELNQTTRLFPTAIQAIGFERQAADLLQLAKQPPRYHLKGRRLPFRIGV